eukprot:382901-Amphidinium_carterae.1
MMYAKVFALHLNMSFFHVACISQWSLVFCAHLSYQAIESEVVHCYTVVVLHAASVLNVDVFACGVRKDSVLSINVVVHVAKQVVVQLTLCCGHGVGLVPESVVTVRSS